jgi:RNA polymerase sigma-70 factor (ECF subfamily)
MLNAMGVDWPLQLCCTASGRSGERGRLQAKESEPSDDEAAVRAFQRGDREAFEGLLVKYRRMVYRLCYRFAGNHEDADDLSQEVFLRVYRGLPGFRGQARFSTWLYRVAVNTCVHWVHTRKAAFELPHNLVDPAPGPLEDLSRTEQSARLREAMERLPPRQRMTLLLRVDQQLSHKEISRILDSPLGTVKANIFFAVENLRKMIKREDG